MKKLRVLVSSHDDIEKGNYALNEKEVIEYIACYNWSDIISKMKTELKDKGEIDHSPDYIKISNDDESVLYIQSWDFNNFSLVFNQENMSDKDPDYYFADNNGFSIYKVKEAINLFYKSNRNSLENLISNEPDLSTGPIRKELDKQLEEGKEEYDKSIKYIKNQSIIIRLLVLVFLIFIIYKVLE